MSSDLQDHVVCPLVEVVHFHKVLRKEVQSLMENSKKIRSIMSAKVTLKESDIDLVNSTKNQYILFLSVFKAHSAAEDNTIWPALRQKRCGLGDVHEVIEDHKKEEANFLKIENKISLLQSHLNDFDDRSLIANELVTLMQQAYADFEIHLDQEEKVVHPMIQKHLSTEEIEVMVGQIMGYRNADMMEIILKMMVRNLSKEDKDYMLGSMQKAVKDTYFEKWLSFLSSDLSSVSGSDQRRHVESSRDVVPSSRTSTSLHTVASSSDTIESSIPILSEKKHDPVDKLVVDLDTARSHSPSVLDAALSLIASCSGLSDSEKEKVIYALQNKVTTVTVTSAVNTGHTEEEESEPAKRRKTNLGNGESALVLCGSAEVGRSVSRIGHADPLIPAVPDEDLTCTYRPGLEVGVLGCKHYRRACKLVSPCCTRAFTCRLCHDEHFQDAHSLDRFSVKHVVCMSCGKIQRTSQQCVDANCGQVFARYFCPICSLFDDDPEHRIYHCPYCNVCRKGRGLGIDFHHCMKCNACVSVTEAHRCIAGSTQSACPICRRYLFDSVEQLKAGRCGHVMHLLCLINHRNSRNNSCPVCRQQMDAEHG